MRKQTAKNNCIQGTAYAQSAIDGFEPAYALDGRNDTSWAAEPYYQWWMFDCGKQYDLDSIIVQTISSGHEFYRYAIDYSTDRINWHELCEKTDDAEPKEEGEYYKAAVTARYIRIMMTYCSNGEKVGLTNVVVTGLPAEAKEQRKKSITKERVRAAECGERVGFTVNTEQLPEEGWQDSVLQCTQGNSYFTVKSVELDNISGQQLKGFFCLPEKDKALHINISIRLDSPEGPVVGVMDMHRQYTPWLQFACDLENGDYGVRDLYFCVDRIDAPQSIQVLWLRIMPKPVLSRAIIDYADEIPSEEGEYRAYLGNFHCHTGFTDGSNTPNFAYDYARYTAGLDFLGITEHSNLFEDPFDASASRKWRDLKRFAQEKTEDGKFLALMGSETTWYNQFGHMNIYGADFFLNPYELRYNNTALYYERLKQFPRVINQWNHPWSCGSRHLDMFEPYDPELDKVMYTLEINSIEWTVMDGLSYYIHALDMGWHVSPVGSQDNHKPNWGTENDIRTGVVVRRLTKADFYDAIRNHRTYYSCAKHLHVIYRVNGAMMGSIIPKAECCHFSVQIDNDTEDAILQKIEVFGEHGAVLFTQPISGHNANVDFCVDVSDRYCFLKVYQADMAFAATAPVWICGCRK